MTAVPRPGDLLLRRYRLLDAHGDTALWRGFLARDEQLEGGEGEPTALLKVVRPELAHDEPSRAYVRRELTRVRLLQHPGILRPTEILISEDQSVVVLLEPIQAGLSQGLLLSRMVAFRRGEDRFKLDEVRRIGVQLASALGYIHGQLLCHGDLRLESVLLRPEGLRLCDVGLGRALPRGPYLDAVERAGEAHLLPPEVRAGRPPDVRSDVFGLAALYRYLLSMGEDAAWLAFQQEHPALAAVLLRGLEADPQARYPSVEALVADVEAVAMTGAPVRRRHSPTPVALAVAAGRLPVEELSRPPEEPRQGTDGRRASGQGLGTDDVVLGPLSTSPSARISIVPREPRSSSPPAPADSGTAAPLPDEEAQPTRRVRKADMAELRAATGEEDSSGISAHQTIPVDRLTEEELAERPRRTGRPLAPEGTDVLDHTVQQARLDPEDAPTTAVPRITPDDMIAQEDGQPTVKVQVEQGALPGSPAVQFQELPPLLPREPPRPAAEDAATGLYTPSQEQRRSTTSEPRLPVRNASGGTSLDSLTPTKPTKAPQAPAIAPSPTVPGGGRLVIAGALLLAAAVGALGAVLIVSLLQPPAPGQALPAPTARRVEAPPAQPRGQPPAVQPRAPGATAPSRAGAAPAATPIPPAAPAVTQAAGCPPGMTTVVAAKPFCIDQHEYPGVGQRPLTGLSHKEALALCDKQGKRLCTDAEWELACRGKGRASYPYGHDVREGICNTRGGTVLPSGSRTACVSAAGAFDMSGNVAEWTQAGNLRGGSAYGETDGRCSVRLKIPPGGRSAFTGARCCR